MPDDLRREAVAKLVADGFSHLAASEIESLLQPYGALSDWVEFAESWNHLGADNHMADKGRYRKRRYGVYNVDIQGRATRQPHQPHFQTLDYNPLNGGIERWFEPISNKTSDGASFQTILRFAADFFKETAAATTTTWHIEAHQFRIEAGTTAPGQPTPEGMHRDGRDYVLVMMIRRENIQSGTTTIHDLNQNTVGSFTLTDPRETAFVDDRRVYHGVTAVHPIDPAKPAYRDVLVLTFSAQR